MLPQAPLPGCPQERPGQAPPQAACLAVHAWDPSPPSLSQTMNTAPPRRTSEYWSPTCQLLNRRSVNSSDPETATYSPSSHCPCAPRIAESCRPGDWSTEPDDHP